MILIQNRIDDKLLGAFLKNGSRLSGLRRLAADVFIRR